MAAGPTFCTISRIALTKSDGVMRIMRLEGPAKRQRVSWKWMGCKPQRAGGREWIYSAVSPPQCLIAAVMDLTVMRTAERHRELIAHLATEGSRLRKAQVVSIRRPPIANQARLFHDMPDMLAVDAPRLGMVMRRGVGRVTVSTRLLGLE
jgi:hypothetical protein